MRWLFLIVLSLNLAYITWGINRSPADSYANVQALKNVQPIVLLSELKQQDQVDSQRVDSQQAESQTVDEVSEQQEDEVMPPLNEQTASSGTDAEQQDAKQKNVQEKVAESVTDKDVVVVDTKVADVVEILQDKSSQAVSSQPDSSQTGNCYTLGPFRDLSKLSSLIRAIKSYVVEANFRSREEKEQSLYWVYIIPEKNHKKAIATGKRLKAKKIKDFYIIREGENTNGISLGYFRNKEGASGLAKKVKKLGFNVVLEPVFKTYTIYWLDYQLVEGSNIPEATFDKYLQTTKKDKISRLSRDCDS